MELPKYPLERLSFFVAGAIPGFVALAIYHLAVPSSFHRFFALVFLGYRMKLAVIFLVSLIIGHTLEELLSRTAGFIGGVLAFLKSEKDGGKPPSYMLDVAPWRDPRWRKLVKKELGDIAPSDTRPRGKARIDLLVKNTAADQQGVERAKLNIEETDAYLVDMEWERWYDQYQQAVLQPKTRPFEWYVHVGFNTSLQTTAFYVLVASIFVPALRHWWLYVICSIWVVIVVLEGHAAVKNAENKWSTLSDQIGRLSGDRESSHPQ
jgi:hypothetical protein